MIRPSDVICSLFALVNRVTTGAFQSVFENGWSMLPMHFPQEGWVPVEITGII
jgi:hypothetical protein